MLLADVAVGSEGVAVLCTRGVLPGVIVNLSSTLTACAVNCCCCCHCCCWCCYCCWICGSDFSAVWFVNYQPKLWITAAMTSREVLIAYGGSVVKDVKLRDWCQGLWAPRFDASISIENVSSILMNNHLCRMHGPKSRNHYKDKVPAIVTNQLWLHGKDLWCCAPSGDHWQSLTYYNWQQHQHKQHGIKVLASFESWQVSCLSWCAEVTTYNYSNRRNRSNSTGSSSSDNNSDSSMTYQHLWQQ